MKTLILSIALAVTSLIVNAQEIKVLPKAAHGIHDLPDSIRIEFQDLNVIVLFQFKDSKNINSRIETFFKRFPQLLHFIEQGAASQQTPLTITVKEQSPEVRTMSILHSPDRTTQIRMNGIEITELLPPGWEIKVVSSDAEVRIYAQTFQQLNQAASYAQTPWASGLRKASETISGQKRILARFILKGDSLIHQEINFQMPEQWLVGGASAGIGMLGDTFYPEVNAVLGLRFGDRFNRNNHRISLIYNNLFFMNRSQDGSLGLHTNSFLSLAWSKNLRGTGEFIGLGAGLLVLRQGDYFRGRTAKFFLTRDVGPVNISPELYLTNDFKTLQMGIRVNFTF